MLSSATASRHCWWGRNKLVIMFQATFPNISSSHVVFCIFIDIQLKSVPVSLIIIGCHWIRQWFGNVQTTYISHYLNIWWPGVLMYICVTCPFMSPTRLDALKARYYLHNHRIIISLKPSDVMWRHISESTLAQVMACCRTASSHYRNHFWLSDAQWYSSSVNHKRHLSHQSLKSTWKLLL